MLTTLAVPLSSAALRDVYKRQDDATTSLLFECATFARDSVRKTSRALGQNSDSSARYEKGVDRHSPEMGLARALHLIQELDCGDITTLEYDLTDGRPLERRHIVTTPAKICGVLGIFSSFHRCLLSRPVRRQSAVCCVCRGGR